MKKLILIAVLMLVSSSIFAQDIFGPPNYFFKRNDSVFVRPGSVFGSASSSTDTSLLVHKIADSQSITATGGDFSITSTDSLNLFAGSDLNIYANNGHITFFADQNITFQSTSEIVFQTSISIEGNTVTSGGTTPASVDGYVTITIDGVNRKIPFINE